MPPDSTAVFAPVGVKMHGSPDAWACRRATRVPWGTSSMPTSPLRYPDSRNLFLHVKKKPGQAARSRKERGRTAHPPRYDIITLSSCFDLMSLTGNEVSTHMEARPERGRKSLPRPWSPAPALLDTAVRFRTSGRFERAVMRVSGMPHSPNPAREQE